MKPSKEELIGLGRLEIATKYKVSEKTAMRWQEYYGLRESKPRLTPDQAKEIRNSELPIKTLASKYDVTLATIYRIKNKITHYSPMAVLSGCADVSVIYNDHYSALRPRISGCADVEVIRSSSAT